MVKAKETNLEGVLEGKKQYQVPLYQRVYGWGRSQIDQLWDDLLEVVETRKTYPTATHFIGSLVLAASPDNGAVGMHKYLVVDGQQRLTTLTLLLAALRDHQVETEGGHHRDRIDDQFLVNKYEAGEPTKVLPTQADRAAYLAVIRSTAGAGSEDAVGETYRNFRSKILAVDDPDDPLDIAAIENAVLRGLAVVAVTAEPGDNAHRIFESLNNTGLRLTQADLIKNYLFMRLGDEAEPVYDSVWLPLERLLAPDNLELLFWLDLVQTDEKATQSDTYIGQQRRLEKLSPSEIRAEVTRIAHLGSVLATILDPGREADPEIRLRLSRLKAWGSTTAFPVVMQLLSKRDSGQASPEQVAKALLCLESYFVRRIVIGRATAGLNRTLMTATSSVANADEVDVALRAYLSAGRRYFGTDERIREAANTVPFYWQGRGAQRKLILQWLEESYGSKEPINPDAFTIEHVLPQTLEGAALEEFAEGLPEDADPMYEHERVVQTLGNLTLTGYNSELSNRAYAQKRTMLAKSGVKLNQEIVTHDRWGVGEIQARGAMLAERMIELWPGPDASAAGGDESDFRRLVSAIVAAIPAGRWTSYSEVAVVAGSYPQPVGTLLTHALVPNAWRVLQATGIVAPLFRWVEPGRSDDPKEILIGEGIEFDTSGRASTEQFISARELADLAGLEVDPDRRGALPASQREFWTRLRDWGLEHATHIPAWREPRARYWYPLPLMAPSVGVELSVLSVEARVAAELYIHDDKDLYARLFAQREAIEADLGMALEWREMPDRKACRIIAFHPGDFRDEGEANNLIVWLVDAADNLTRVLSKRIEALPR